MAYNDKWRTKLVIDVVVSASSKERADRRWQDVLEKIKYQTPNVVLISEIEPNWKLETENDDDD
jgi:hypothetical protein